MAKLYIKEQFGITPNALLNNTEISLKAKGLFGYLQSKPDNWEFSARKISSQTKEGKTSVSAGLQELEEFGYLVRKKRKNNAGHWAIDYTLVANPVLENPTLENPVTGNLYNKSKKELSKKELSKKESKTPKQVNEDFFNNPETIEATIQAISKHYGTDRNFVEMNVNDFHSYWTELNSTGNKQRWQLQPTFDVKKRIVTWFKRIKQFKPAEKTAKKTLVL